MQEVTRMREKEIKNMNISTGQNGDRKYNFRKKKM